MTKLKKFFELNRKYKFDPTDLTAVIFTIAAIMGMSGLNPTIPFFIGSAIGTAFCWQARRINLVLLNGALFVLNLYNLIQLF